ncbi:Uncharacterised protein [Mycobacteroides abscessus subsp. abscessus]|nr:Uncharacterised protein [Mycobacteroides abscessus subsp. abscessus]
MGVLGLDGVGVEDAGESPDEVVGVERGAGDVTEGALVVVGFADDRVGGALGEMAHRPASVRIMPGPLAPSCSAKKRSSEERSIAVRYRELARWSSIGVPSAARVSAASWTVSSVHGLPSIAASVARARSGVAATPPRPMRALSTMPSETSTA